MPVTRTLRLDHLVKGAGAALVPLACPGCGHPDVGVCRGCAAPFTGPARDVRLLAGSAAPWWRGTKPPAVAVVRYEQQGAAVLRAWKDQGRRDLTPLMALAVGRSVTGSLRGADAAGALPGVVGVVTVPSSRRSDAQRGGNLVAAAVALAWPRIRAAAATHDIEVVRGPALRRRGRVKDQAGLGVRSRARNISDSMVVASPGTSCAAVILVDDVLTTGASLSEAHRALTAFGCPVVVGAATVAVTPRVGRGSTDARGPGIPVHAPGG